MKVVTTALSRKKVPNHIESLLIENPSIKIIAFKGNKAAKLFKKYFMLSTGYTFLHLLSSSPANASINWKIILGRWMDLKINDV
ncbi:MAG: hypothetical protein H7296_02965 [Bacteroidia bacterium]|nr:hypothetical protein [Bacteroidia bacterium]